MRHLFEPEGFQSLNGPSVVRDYSIISFTYLFIMSIKPLSDHIVIEALKQEEKTKSGIYLPETAKEKPEQGKVIAVGPGKKNEQGVLIPLEVKVGDVVLFTKYGPNEITVDEKEYLVAREEDILAIIEQ